MIKNWKRNAGFFVGGQFASLFGSMLVQYAITWHITLETQSGIWMTLFTCAALLPMVFISPFAGVWADRYSRKFLIIISDASIAAATLVLAVLFLAGYRDMWLMLAVVIIRSVGQGIQQPAVNAFIPQIVPQEHLMKFNGIQGAVQSLTMFASPMLAMALLSSLPMEYIFFIDVITAAIGISIVIFLVSAPQSKSQKAEEPLQLGVYFAELKEGLSYIFGIKWLRQLLIYSAVFGVLMTPAAMLTALQVTRSFGDDVWRLTTIEVLFSVGMALGGVIISIWGGYKNKTHTIILACFAFSVSTFLLGVVPNFWLYIFVMLFCGLTVPAFNTPVMTIMQSRIDATLTGRVFSVMTMINGLAMPLGMAFFGPLSDVVRIETLLIVTGVLLFGSGFILLGSKPLIAAGIIKTAEGEKQ